MMMTQEQAREFASRWLPAWTGNDPERLAGFYSDDAFYLDPAIPDGVRGKDALLAYFREPVMLASLAVIFVVPAGLLVARLLGFSPKTQILTALETIVANLCWLPPLVGSLAEKSRDQ